MIASTLVLPVADLLAYLRHRARMPKCPRCRSRRWDRSLCRPLLLCTRCWSRIDAAGTLVN